MKTAYRRRVVAFVVAVATVVAPTGLLGTAAAAGDKVGFGCGVFKFGGPKPGVVAAVLPATLVQTPACRA